MEQAMVVVTNNYNVQAEAICCKNEQNAKAILQQLYLREIQKAIFCNIDNTYITEERNYAHIQNGLQETMIRICKPKCYGKRTRKKYNYKKRKRAIKTNIQ